MLRKKNDNKLDYQSLNEVIDISKKILKVTLYNYRFSLDFCILSNVCFASFNDNFIRT